MSTRFQKKLTFHGEQEFWFNYEGKMYVPSYGKNPVDVFETQRTQSVGTPFKSRRKAKNKLKGFTDFGSDFFTTKSVIFPPKVVDLTADHGGSIVQRYKGPYWAYGPSANVLLNGPTFNEMSAYGASCIARVLPTNPLSGMGQFLGELRDLPKLPYLTFMKRKANNFREIFRSLGSEYLNVQFGWVPFVKDLLQFSETLAKHDEKVAQYDRDSGRLVRRRITLFDSSVTTVSNPVDGYGYPTLGSPHYTHPGKLTETVTTSTKIWFSGAFTYYFESGFRPHKDSKTKGGHVTKFIPGGSDPSLIRARNAQIANKLYGLRLDPYLFYQLYPWSWAADWITNLGSNIRNIVAFQNDGLVLNYGYVMCLKRTTTRRSLESLGFVQGDQTFHDVIVQVTKTRQKATPYGFGLNPTSFDARQWSIIAALGISRKPRGLGT